jgi:hypothetical protein
MLSLGAPPQAGLPVGQDVTHAALAGLFALPPVTQHVSPMLQSMAAAHSTAPEPVGHAAAVAAQVPCTWPPAFERQHTCGQFGQSLLAVRGPASALPLLAPVLAPLLPLPLVPTPPLPLPLVPKLPLLLPLPPSPPPVVLLPPHAAASATPSDAMTKTCTPFMKASSFSSSSPGCCLFIQ